MLKTSTRLNCWTAGYAVAYQAYPTGPPLKVSNENSLSVET
jgi:hypothetical protein